MALSPASYVANVRTWTRRLRFLCPIGAHWELVAFDVRALEKLLVSGAVEADVPLRGTTAVPLQQGQRRPGYTSVSTRDTRPAGSGQDPAHRRGVCLLAESKSGGLTAFNRHQRQLPKPHGIDTACTGKSTPLPLRIAGAVPPVITATGHGREQTCCVNANDVPCSQPQGIDTRFCMLVSRGDGSTYQAGGPFAQPHPAQSVSEGTRQSSPERIYRGHSGTILICNQRLQGLSPRIERYFPAHLPGKKHQLAA